MNIQPSIPEPVLGGSNIIPIFFLIILTTPVATAISRNIPFVYLSLSVFLIFIYIKNDKKMGVEEFINRSFIKHLDRSNFIILAASLTFPLTSLLWSDYPMRGFGALAQTAFVVLLTTFSCAVVNGRVPVLCWLDWALPLAVVAGCLVVLFELSFGSPLRGLLGASTEPFRLNRATILTSLMLPLLFLLPSRQWSLLAKILVTCLAWVTAFVSDSESAQIAAVVVTSVLLVNCCIRPRIVVMICAFGALLSHAFAPAIAWGIYNLVPTETFEFLGQTQHLVRAQIWWAHAIAILDAPFFGHGLQSSLAAADAFSGSDPRLIYGLSNGHPHNFSLQVWYELGLLGVVLSTALMWLVLRRALRLPEGQLGIAAALLSGVWAVAYVSHGAWQHWWWAMVGILTILFVSLSKLQTQLRSKDVNEVSEISSPPSNS